MAASYRIAVVGDRDSVLGFQALGLSAFPAHYAVIYLTETLAAQMPGDVARYQDALAPAVILIPGKEGSLGIGLANIKSAVERAVGADIL